MCVLLRGCMGAVCTSAFGVKAPCATCVVTGPRSPHVARMCAAATPARAQVRSRLRARTTSDPRMVVDASACFICLYATCVNATLKPCGILFSPAAG